MNTTYFINTCFWSLRDKIKKDGGFNESIFCTPIGKEYLKAMDLLRSFDGQHVKITYLHQIDIHENGGEANGLIKVIKDQVVFFKGKRTRMGTYLDAGLFYGFHNTVIPLSVNIIPNPIKILKHEKIK